MVCAHFRSGCLIPFYMRIYWIAIVSGWVRSDITGISIELGEARFLIWWSLCLCVMFWEGSSFSIWVFLIRVEYMHGGVLYFSIYKRHTNSTKFKIMYIIYFEARFRLMSSQTPRLSDSCVWYGVCVFVWCMDRGICIIVDTMMNHALSSHNKNIISSSSPRHINPEPISNPHSCGHITPRAHNSWIP